jgi:hypothetical protein
MWPLSPTQPISRSWAFLFGVGNTLKPVDRRDVTHTGTTAATNTNHGYGSLVIVPFIFPVTVWLSPQAGGEEVSRAHELRAGVLF